MKNEFRRSWGALFALLVLPGTAGLGAEKAVSLRSLLQEMTDRARPARLPKPAYTCRQFSSFDREATGRDKKETWFANWDRSQFVRIEERQGRKEHVLMDAEGPGAIVRFWATWHGWWTVSPRPISPPGSPATPP